MEFTALLVLLGLTGAPATPAPVPSATVAATQTSNDKLFTTGVSLRELLPPPETPNYISGPVNSAGLTTERLQRTEVDLSPGVVLPYARSAHRDLDSVVVNYRGREVDLTAVVERAARAENLDPLLVKLVVQQESGFQPDIASGVGAAGLMQLMPETAADLGCADRLDPEQNVEAGTRYLGALYRQYGDLDLALAAYNAGPGNVDYYGGVPPFEETQHYVQVIGDGYRAQKEPLRR